MKGRRPVRILSICDHEAVRESRELVLRHAGYQVESAKSTARFTPAWVRTFDMAILCHSVSEFRAWRIGAALRNASESIHLIRIHATPTSKDSFYDLDFGLLPSPGALLEGVKVLSSTPMTRH